MLQPLQHRYQDVVPHVVLYHLPTGGTLALRQLLQTPDPVRDLAEVVGHVGHELVAGLAGLAQHDTKERYEIGVRQLPPRVQLSLTIVGLENKEESCTFLWRRVFCIMANHQATALTPQHSVAIYIDT